jgi:predicted ribosome quality control (RQC) complex YloA/Tae2 family protein
VHQETLSEIVGELEPLLPGRFLGKVFQLSAVSVAIDLGIRDQGYLFISIEPGQPRLYLINRSARELEKASQPLSSFAQAMRSTLGGGNLISLTKDENERVVRFCFSVVDDVGDFQKNFLVAQLTGRSANLFLLDSESKITHAWRTPQVEGQRVGSSYRPPTLNAKSPAVAATIKPAKLEAVRLSREGSLSMSETADNYYSRLQNEKDFDNAAASLLAKLRKEIAKRQKLKTNLQQDLIAHGRPEQHKRMGDLLLANIANAVRSANKVSLIDYYADSAPTIEIEIDENATLQEAAGEYFSHYTKAKRAVEEIGTRLLQVERELAEFSERQLKLEQAIANRNPAALAGFVEAKVSPTASRKKQKASLTIPGMRRYRSSDGYEVLVGRTARDNDQLTFRLARPNDLWLHAGDYPGSHVIVRNSSRNDIPHRTIIEAAQLAAKFSQASKDSKVTIHYTRRKFLTKPKGAAPGLVRMSSFKSITVEPGENLERIIQATTG